MKWRPAEGLAAGLAGIALAGALAMMPAHAASERALFISLGAAARAPVGWKEFCVEYAPECDTVPLAPTDVVLTSQDWNELVRTNEWVNDAVKPLTDVEHWGVAERWNYPDDGFGDCEDYVLLKRKVADRVPLRETAVADGPECLDRARRSTSGTRHRQLALNLLPAFPHHGSLPTSHQFCRIRAKRTFGGAADHRGATRLTARPT